MDGPVLEGEGTSWPLPWAEVQIGRADALRAIRPHVDLDQLDPERSVSRRHAQLRRTPEGGYVVRDHASANGSSIDGRPLRAHEDVAVADGSRLTFGDVRTVFRLAGTWPEDLEPEWAHAPTPAAAPFHPEGTRLGRRDLAPPPAPVDTVRPLPWYRRLGAGRRRATREAPR